MQQNIDLSETILKRLPFFIRSVLNPQWHTSVWQWRVAQTEKQAARKRISVWDIKGRLFAEFTGDIEREKDRKKTYMGLRSHLYWFLSLSFFSISLFVSACVSPFDDCVFQVQVVFWFSPNEADGYDSSAFPLSPLTPLTSFTRGVFFPLTFQCTCHPVFSHSLFFSAGLSVVLSLSHIHRQLFSLLRAKTFASLSLSISVSLCLLFCFFSLSSSPNK